MNFFWGGDITIQSIAHPQGTIHTERNVSEVHWGWSVHKMDGNPSGMAVLVEMFSVPLVGVFLRKYFTLPPFWRTFGNCQNPLWGLRAR